MKYDVAGADISGVAIEKARELTQRLGYEIAYHQSSWVNLSSRVNREFDCILNDALTWAETEDEVSLSIAEFGRLLRPGGIVLWAGPDEWNGRGSGNRERMHERLEGTILPFSIEGPFEHDGVRMIRVVTRKLEHDFVDVTNLYIIEENGQLYLEHDRLPEPFRWTWEHFEKAFKDAGFSELHSHRVTLDAKERILNVAVK
jgi:SAM-dependent methyltransferase